MSPRRRRPVDGRAAEVHPDPYGPRRSLLTDEQPTGGWRRDASGHLVHDTPTPAPASDPPAEAGATPTDAGGFVSGLVEGGRQGMHQPRPARSRSARRAGRRTTTGPRLVGPVRAPGTTGGVLLALVTYPVFIAFLRGGTPAVRQWAAAKFLNKGTGAGSTPALPGSGNPVGPIPTWQGHPHNTGAPLKSAPKGSGNASGVYGNDPLYNS